MNGVSEDQVSTLPYVFATKGELAIAPNGKSLSIPKGFPVRVDNSKNWTLAELEDVRSQWIVNLEVEDIAAIEQTVDTFVASKQDLQSLSRATFPLPLDLSTRLDDISRACYEGLGFCILRGLPVLDKTQLQKAIMFGGVSAHVAPDRGFQDVDRKHVLAHLFKRHAKTTGEYVPPSFDNEPLSFHTDDGDIVALFYPIIPENGGRTQLASQPQMYNELNEKRPDLLAKLTEDWLIDQYYQQDRPPRKLPLLHLHGENGITFQHTRLPFSRYKGSRTPRPDIPALTNEQTEALDALQILATKHAFPVPTQSGDILFFNNLELSHGREPYEETSSIDTEPTDMDRHVLRLWLRDPKRTTQLSSKVLGQIWEDIYGHNTDYGRKEIWNIEATAAYAMNASKNG